MAHQIWNTVHINASTDLLACVLALDTATAGKSSAFYTSLLPRHSSPTGRTSGPQPDLPSPSQLPNLPPSCLLLFQDCGDPLRNWRIQVNHHWLPVRVRDLLRLMMHAVWSPGSQGSLPEEDFTVYNSHMSLQLVCTHVHVSVHWPKWTSEWDSRLLLLPHVCFWVTLFFTLVAPWSSIAIAMSVLHLSAWGEGLSADQSPFLQQCFVSSDSQIHLLG